MGLRVVMAPEGAGSITFAGRAGEIAGTALPNRADFRSQIEAAGAPVSPVIAGGASPEWKKRGLLAVGAILLLVGGVWFALQFLTIESGWIGIPRGWDSLMEVAPARDEVHVQSGGCLHGGHTPRILQIPGPAPAQLLQPTLHFRPAFLVRSQAALSLRAVEHPGVNVIAQFHLLVQTLGGCHRACARHRHLVAIDRVLQRLQDIRIGISIRGSASHRRVFDTIGIRFAS